MKRLLYLFSLLLFVFSSGTCDEDPFLWDATSRTYKYVTVVSSVPSISAVNVVKNTRLMFQFSQKMDTNSFQLSDVTLSSSVGNVSSSKYTASWQDGNTTLVLTPTGVPLASDTIYSLNLSGDNLRSASGNPMNGNFSSAFTTSNIADTVSPAISSHCVVTTSGCVTPSGIIYPVNGVKYIFDEAMSPTDVESAFSFVVNGVSQNFSTTWSTDNTTVTFNFGTISSGSAVADMGSGAQDAAGNNVSNPTNSTFSIGGGNVIDYMVTSSTQPTSGSPGASISGVQFVLSNIGQINGGQVVNWTAYLSSDNVYNTGDTQIGSGTSPALNGSTSSPSITASTGGSTWPAAAGQYYLIVNVTASDDQVTANDSYVAADPIPVGVPDYVVTNPTYPTSGVSGDSFSGSFTISNIGSNAGSANVNYNVYLSTSTSVIGATSILTGSVAGMAAGGVSGTVNYNGIWPAGGGTYYVLIKVSAADDVVTGNDTAISNFISVSGVPVPDYIVVTPTYPTSGNTNTNFSGSFRIKNQGGADGGNPVSWVVYESTNNVYDVSDMPIVWGTRSALPAGTTSTLVSYSGSWTSAGTKYLIIRVSAVDDFSVNNNTNISGAIAVSSPAAPTVNVPASPVNYPSPVALSWSAMTGATGYNIYRGTASGGPYTLIGTSTAASYDDFGAPPSVAGITYFYRVRADYSGALSNYSNERWAVRKYAALSITPTSVYVKVNNSTIFSASGGNGTYTFSVVTGGGSFAGATYTAPGTPQPVTVRVTDGIQTVSAAINVYTVAGPAIGPAPVLWLKADSMPFNTNGSPVDLWIDASGNGNSASQLFGANQPTFRTGVLNGLPVVQFNSNHWLNVPDHANLNSVTAFVVVRYGDTSTGCSYCSNDVGNIFYMYAHTAFGFQTAARISSGGTNSNVFVVQSMRHGGNTVTGYVNGTQVTTHTDTGTGPIQGVDIGQWGGGGINLLNGDIAEVIVYNTALNATDRSAVETYLMGKYGL